MEFKKQSNRGLIIAIIVGCLLIAAAIVFAIVWINRDVDICLNSAKVSPDPTKELYKSNNGKYTYGSVASESKICSDIGKRVLARYQGHAVDAMIATIFCNGVEHPQSSGIGGGAFFVIYDTVQGFSALNAREMAPAASTRDMYVNDTASSKLGGKAVGVPGELKGLIEAHAKYGRVPWKTLVQPAIKLCKEGWELSAAVQERVVALKNRTGFEDFLDPAGKPLLAGKKIKNPRLAATLETIANDPWSFYNGSLADDIVKDLQERGGIITADDLKNFKAEWTNTTMMKLPDGLSIHSMPPPGSGAIISYILSILAGYGFKSDSISNEAKTIETYHRIVEAMKFAYGKRSMLGDAAYNVDVEDLVKNLTSRDFGESTRKKIVDEKTQPLEYYDSDFYSPENHGTNHMSVVDTNGNAVAVTTTVNLYFGSKVLGSRTGIVFNNEMDDFSTPNLINAFGFPPSRSNFIEPGKRPQSSMSPSIIINDTTKKVEMVVGAAGGSRITSTSALLIMDFFWFNMSMAQAMDLPRFHHQLLPNNISVENEFPQNLRDGLKAKGHEIHERSSAMSVAHSIAFRDGLLEAVSDYRKGGSPAGY